MLALSVDPKWRHAERRSAAFVRNHRLLPQFHYLAGTSRELERIWEAVRRDAGDARAGRTPTTRSTPSSSTAAARRGSSSTRSRGRRRSCTTSGCCSRPLLPARHRRACRERRPAVLVDEHDAHARRAGGRGRSPRDVVARRSRPATSRSARGAAARPDARVGRAGVTVTASPVRVALDEHLAVGDEQPARLAAPAPDGAVVAGRLRRRPSSSRCRSPPAYASRRREGAAVGAAGSTHRLRGSAVRPSNSTCVAGRHGRGRQGAEDHRAHVDLADHARVDRAVVGVRAGLSNWSVEVAAARTGRRSRRARRRR